jgi:MoaA/NifB/PqqE/SkfB family radical SAM enzyme
MNFKTFCAAPWVHANVNTRQQLTPCCVSRQRSNMSFDQFDQWWHSDTMNLLRKDSITGKKNSDCETCWNSEEQGRSSLRQNYNILFKSYIDYELLRQHDALTFDNVKNPVTWELDIGNLCNLKCVMCLPAQSDKIQQEITNNESAFKSFPLLVDYAKRKIDKNWLDTPQGQEFLNTVRSDLQWIKLQGGEALTVKNIRDFIEKLDHKETVLSITTNGTVLDKKLLHVLAQIKKVQISISIESANTVNDVIRYGSDWTTILDNINTLCKMPNVELQINHVLQATSAMFLPGVIELVENRNLHLAIIPLENHPYLSLSAVPPALLQKMIDAIIAIDIKHPKNQYIKNFVSTVVADTKFDKTIQDQFVYYINTLDSLRDSKLLPFCKEIIST